MSHRIEGGVPPEDSRDISSPISSPDDLSIEQAPKDLQAKPIARSQPLFAPVDLDALEDLTQLDENAIAAFKAQIDLMADDLEQLIDKIETLNPDVTPKADPWLEEHTELLVEAALKQLEAAEDWGKATEGVMEFPAVTAELAESLIAVPLEKVVGAFEELEGYTRAPAVGIMDAQLALKVPEVLGKSANLIYKRMMVKHLRKQVNLMMLSSDEETVKKAKKLKGWVDLQDELITEESVQLGLETLAYSPKALKAILLTLDKFPNIVAYGDLWMAAVTGVILNSYQVYKTRKAVKTQEDWLEEIKQKPLTQEPIVAGKAPITLKNEIEKIRAKRENAFEVRKQEAKAEFLHWLEVEAKKEQPFDRLTETLEAKGVHLDKLEQPITSQEELLTAIQTSNPSINLLLVQYVEHKQTVSTLTRNAIKTLSEKKQKVEKKFNKFELNKSKVALAISIITFAAVIAMKTLALAGIIAIPAACMAATGAGIFVIGIALMIVGLIYLYKTKPHLFKEFFKGTQLQMALYGIPHAIDNFVAKIKQVKKLKESMRIMMYRAQAEELRGILEQNKTITASTLPKHLRPLLKELKLRSSKKLEEADVILAKQRLAEIEKDAVKESEKKQAELDKDIERWTARAQKWQKKLDPLQKRVREAGSKDFARAAKLAENRNGDPMSIEQVIVDNLFEDPELIDEDTTQLLEKELGIDLEALRQDPDAKKVKQDTLEALQTFFAMDNTKIVSFIREQQAKEKYA